MVESQVTSSEKAKRRGGHALQLVNCSSHCRCSLIVAVRGLVAGMRRLEPSLQMRCAIVSLASRISHRGPRFRYGCRKRLNIKVLLKDVGVVTVRTSRSSQERYPTAETMPGSEHVALQILSSLRSRMVTPTSLIDWHRNVRQNA